MRSIFYINEDELDKCNYGESVNLALSKGFLEILTRIFSHATKQVESELDYFMVDTLY